MMDNIRILFVGETNVGKSCIIARCDGGQFEENQKPTQAPGMTTIGVDLGDSKFISLDSYDISGKDISQISKQIVFKDEEVQEAKGCFIVYDITNQESFNKVKNWLDKVHEEYGDIPIILVGNKSDLEDKRQVSKEEGEKLAEELKAGFFETSAQNGNNIEEIFKSMGKAIELNVENNSSSKKPDNPPEKPEDAQKASPVPEPEKSEDAQKASPAPEPEKPEDAQKTSPVPEPEEKENSQQTTPVFQPEGNENSQQATPVFQPEEVEIIPNTINEQETTNGRDSSPGTQPYCDCLII